MKQLVLCHDAKADHAQGKLNYFTSMKEIESILHFTKLCGLQFYKETPFENPN